MKRIFVLTVLVTGVAANFVKINPPEVSSKRTELRSLLLNPYWRQVKVDQSFKDIAINSHNQCRFSVSPAATNMHTAVWNDDLAAVAQQYAEQCIWAHNPDRTAETRNKIWSPEYVGENLYLSGYTLTDDEHMETAVRLWDEEKKDYDFDTNTCRSTDPGCGHYTQLVWHNSALVGCGVHYCSNLQGTIVACNYGPGGNYRGEKPYSTDISQTPCTVSPCLHGGRCTTVDSSYVCICTPAYTGTNCEQAVVCATSSCQNGGICTPSADGTSYTCSCAPGFTGSNCQTAVPCQSQPCQNGGTCTEKGDTYTCSCDNGFAGPNCETALTSGQFSCGFESDMCGFSQTATSFEWIRRSGSTPSPNTGPSSASQGEVYAYIEVSGSWNDGDNAVLESGAIFAGGQRCLKFDYHMYGKNIGTLEVSAGGTVLWSKSGPSQENKWQSAEVQTSSLANQKLAFKGTYGGGYMGDIAIDNIRVSPGGCNSPCSTQPCLNGGTCEPSGSSYTCSCTSSYTGTNCEKESACAAKPCKNGGVCTTNGDSYTCTCPSSFSGPDCSQQASALKNYDCDFEQSLCGLVQSQLDTSDWTRSSGGPTVGMGSDYYIYMDGSQGTNAIVETPAPFSSGIHCLKIGFNMEGDGTVIELLSGTFVFFQIKDSTAGYWYEYALDLPDGLLGTRKLSIKATVGSGSTAYVAIDNLSVRGSTCSSLITRGLKRTSSDDPSGDITDTEPSGENTNPGNSEGIEPLKAKLNGPYKKSTALSSRGMKKKFSGNVLKECLLNLLSSLS